MLTVKKYEFIKGNDNKEYCRYTLINEEGQEIVETKILLLEDCTINPEVSIVLKEFKKNSKKVVEPTNKQVLSRVAPVIAKTDETKKETVNSAIVAPVVKTDAKKEVLPVVTPIVKEETKKPIEAEKVNTAGTIKKNKNTDNWFKRNKSKLVKTVIALALIAGIIVGVHSCTKEKENTVIAPTTTEANMTEAEQAPINQEQLAKITADFINDLKSKGIEITTNEALNFVAVANIDTIINDDEKLANELFGDKDSEELLSAAGKVIGMIHTYNAKYYLKNQTTDGYIDASSVIYDEEDKAKLAILENNVTTVGKSLKVTDITAANAAAQGSLDALNDPTVGFTIDGKKDSERLSSGAGFISAITLADTNFVGLNTWDGNGMINTISKEVEDGLVVEGNGAEYVSNVMTMIEDCSAVTKTTETSKILTK